MPFPPPGDLPNPGIEPESPVAAALQVDSFTAEPLGKTRSQAYTSIKGYSLSQGSDISVNNINTFLGRCKNLGTLNIFFLRHL